MFGSEVSTTYLGTVTDCNKLALEIIFNRLKQYAVESILAYKVAVVPDILTPKDNTPECSSNTAVASAAAIATDVYTD